MEITTITIAALAAFSAGFFDAIAGGGGIITFPTLLMLGLPVSTTVGTGKLIASCGTSIATLTFLKAGQINKEIVRYALPFTSIFSLVGAALVLAISNEILKPLVTVLIFGLAVYMTFKPDLGSKSCYTSLTRNLKIGLIAGASVIGFYDGFFGPGTGMFLTYLMVRFLGLDFVSAAGNTKCLNLASNVVPLILFLKAGNIRYDLAIPMALANMLGGYLGARSAIEKGPKLVRIISIAMTLALSIKISLEIVN
jgi:uncharacterized membrane protein YfcA